MIYLKKEALRLSEKLKHYTDWANKAKKEAEFFNEEASRINKRTCHITIELAEIEG